VQLWEASAPVTTITLSPPPDGTGQFREPVSVTIEPSSGFGGYQSYCSIDGAAAAPVTAPFTLGSSATYTLSCYTTDVTGRAGDAQNVTLQVDLSSSQGCDCTTGAGGPVGLLGLLALMASLRVRRREIAGS
jgi:MYXO-CTERM domain-containing protein